MCIRDRFPTAQLHWIIADTTGAVVVESVRDGLKAVSYTHLYFAYLSKFQVPTDKKVKDLSKGMRFRLSRSSERWKMHVEPMYC